VQLLFFYLPFGFLLARVAAIRPSLRDLRLALGVQVLLGIVFAAVAFWQYASRDVFWNPKIIVGNEYAAFFRVNSLFYDASIYGRFMAVTIVLVAGVAIDTVPGEKDLMQVVRVTFRSWVAALAEQLEAAGVPSRRATPIALAALAAMEGALILCRAEGNVRPLDAVAEELMRLLPLERPTRRKRPVHSS